MNKIWRLHFWERRAVATALYVCVGVHVSVCVFERVIVDCVGVGAVCVCGCVNEEKER